MVDADHSLPGHPNRQMIRVCHTTDKVGGSSPLLQLEQSLSTYKQLRYSRSDSTPFASPAYIPLVPGPLPVIHPTRATDAPIQRKKGNQEGTAPAISHMGKVLQIFWGKPTLLLKA